MATKAIEATPQLIIKIERSLTQENVNDLITTALEGGTGYWGQFKLVRSAKGLAVLNQTDLDADEWWTDKAGKWEYEFFEYEETGGDASFKTYAPEDKQNFPNGYRNLNLKTLGEGIEKYFAMGRAYDPEEVDAEVADVIVQLAVFGTIVYG